MIFMENHIDPKARRLFAMPGVIPLTEALARVFKAAEQHELALLGRYSLNDLTAFDLLRTYIRDDLVEPLQRMLTDSPQSFEYTAVFDLPDGIKFCSSYVRWQSRLDPSAFDSGEAVACVLKDRRFLFPKLDASLLKTPASDDPLHARITAYSKERLRLHADTLAVLGIIWRIVTESSNASQVALAFPSLAPKVKPKPRSSLPRRVVECVWLDELEKAIKMANQWLALGELSRYDCVPQYMTSILNPLSSMTGEFPLLNGWFASNALRVLYINKFPSWMV